MPKRAEVRFTDAYIRNLKPADARYDVYDASLAGFGLRVSPTGTKSWIVLSRNLNRKTRATLGRYPQLSLADARQRAMTSLQMMADGEFNREKSFDTFEQALEEWYSKDQSKNKSFGQVRSAVELHVRPALKNYKLKDIQKRDIIKLVDLVGRTAPTQANRVLAFTKRFFNWCVSRDLLDVSPANGIAKFSNEVSRDRVLNESELEKVLNATFKMRYPFGPLFRILLMTGQRLNEVSGLTWSEIDMPSATWKIPRDRAKNKASHLVHLSQPVFEELERLRTISRYDLIFTTTGKTAVSGFSRAKHQLDNLSGIRDWRLHDLRRTFATVATEKLGFQPVIVDRILNHISGSVKGVAAVYQRGEYLEQRRIALDAWGHYLLHLQSFELGDSAKDQG